MQLKLDMWPLVTYTNDGNDFFPGIVVKTNRVLRANHENMPFYMKYRDEHIVTVFTPTGPQTIEHIIEKEYSDDADDRNPSGHIIRKYMGDK